MFLITFTAMEGVNLVSALLTQNKEIERLENEVQILAKENMENQNRIKALEKQIDALQFREKASLTALDDAHELLKDATQQITQHTDMLNLLEFATTELLPS